MGDSTKRPSVSNEDGHRKKHHPSDHWRHYDVSGQFNACVSDPENQSEDSKDENTKNDTEKSSEGQDNQICLDGDLRGDAHVNSKGLIVGQAEVQSKNNAIDVNFEMQANRKHKHKHKDDKSKGSRKPTAANDNTTSECSPGGPHPPTNDQNSSESDDSIKQYKPKYSSNAHAGRSAQLPTPALTGTESGSSREASGEVSGGETGSGENVSGDSGEGTGLTASGDASSESNGSSNNSVNGNNNATDETNSVESKDGSPSSGAESRESSKSNMPFDLVSTQVNQAPFIQKLYAMLEDTKLQHIIRWAPTFDRFYINPNEQFSKTLCLYFKHTNISSFVRQLSMYGFHKVSNSSHPRDKYYPWEFRHMDGLFKRGDLDSLRSIKRRSTRQMNSKRVKYMAVVNGNEPQVKHEPSPSYIPGPLPVASPVAQGLPHYPTEQQMGGVPFSNANTSHQSPMPQRMIYPELNGNGNSAANGHAMASTNHQYGVNNGMANGNGHGPSAMIFSNNSGFAPSPKESAVRLMRMHQAVKSQLVMVQETMGRLSDNVNEMGVAIDQIVSEQTAPHCSLHSGHPEGAGKPAIKDVNRMNNNEAITANSTTGTPNPPQLVEQQLRTSSHFSQPPQPLQQHGPTPPAPVPAVHAPPPPPSQTYQQDDIQNRFQLRTLLN